MIRPCRIDGCLRDHYAQGLCRAHYDLLDSVQNGPMAGWRYGAVVGGFTVIGTWVAALAARENRL